MERYELNDKDKKLIEIGLDVLEKNFDDAYIIIPSAVQFFARTAISTRV